MRCRYYRPRNKNRVKVTAPARFFFSAAPRQSRNYGLCVKSRLGSQHPYFWPDDYHFNGCHCIYADKNPPNGKNMEEHSDLGGGC
ncbi:hypothetical protein KCP69_00080 [Salmonella enterica subsp. enterica]|nr:hypothetical protein KCP69_00080 [Salmonella enterica subsp. enterica]